jgi:hypothetical protein
MAGRPFEKQNFDDQRRPNHVRCSSNNRVVVATVTVRGSVTGSTVVVLVAVSDRVVVSCKDTLPLLTIDLHPS